jgi:hypothetical protein
MFHENIERFGEVRSLLQGAPSAGAMAALVRCVLDVELLEREEVEARWLPHIAAGIERWYAQVPYAPATSHEYTGWYHMDPLILEPYLTALAFDGRSCAPRFVRSVWAQRRELEPRLLEAAAAGWLARLEGLTLGHIVDGEAVAGALEAMPRLRGLCLQETGGLTRAAYEALCAGATIRRLEALELVGGGEASRLADALDGGPMRHLSVSLEGLSAGPMGRMVGGCAGLESLALCYMSLGDDVFDGLPEHDTLRVLDLNMAGVRAAHMEALGGWGPLHALTSLRISVCGMGDDGLAALTDVIRPSSALRTLELHGCGVTDVGVNQRFTQALRGLERLRLSSNALGEEAIVALTSNTWPRLQALDLGFCGLGGEQIEALARGLDRFEALGSLSLQDDEVGDEGVIAIMDAMPPTLTHLHLPSAGITDAGALRIAAHPRLAQLRRLVLSGNTIGADAQVELYISPHNQSLDIKFG